MKAFLTDFLKENKYQIIALKGDGSNRKIFRIKSQAKTFILVKHQNKDENKRFILLSQNLKNCGLNAPKIYQVNSNYTLYLQQDLGEKNFAEQIVDLKKNYYLTYQKKILSSYQLIIKELKKLNLKGLQVLNRCNIGHSINDFFNEDLIFFQNYFLKYFDKENKFQKKLNLEIEELITNLVGYNNADKQGLVTRDFQARNIIFYKDCPYFIDYQDASRGSVLYDLASLFFASHSGLNWENINYLIQFASKELGYLEQDFLQKFFLFVLIRRLRSLATYTKLGYLEERKNFQNHFKTTFSYLVKIEQNFHAYQAYPTIKKMIYYFYDKFSD